MINDVRNNCLAWKVHYDDTQVASVAEDLIVRSLCYVIGKCESVIADAATEIYAELMRAFFDHT